MGALAAGSVRGGSEALGAPAVASACVATTFVAAAPQALTTNETTQQIDTFKLVARAIQEQFMLRDAGPANPPPALLPPILEATNAGVQIRDALSRWGTLALVISSTPGCGGAPRKLPQATIAKPAPSAPVVREEPPGMIEVTGATFMMGSVYTKPHRETVGDFEIGRTEVTTAAYRKCVAAGACAAPGELNLDDFKPPQRCREILANECNFARTDRELHPINCITVGQAEVYCKWRGQRLPTEQEWELAARGTTGRKYPWGESPWTPERANLCDERCMRVLNCPFAPVSTTLRDGYLTSAPVGSFPRGETPSGIEDMVGNLEEITSTVDHGDSSQVALNPGNIGRGGSWASDGNLAFRSEIAATLVVPQVGFRCAHSAQTAPK